MNINRFKYRQQVQVYIAQGAKDLWCVIIDIKVYFIFWLIVIIHTAYSIFIHTMNDS